MDLSLIQDKGISKKKLQNNLKMMNRKSKIKTKILSFSFKSLENFPSFQNIKNSQEALGLFEKDKEFIINMKLKSFFSRKKRWD